MTLSYVFSHYLGQSQNLHPKASGEQRLSPLSKDPAPSVASCNHAIEGGVIVCIGANCNEWGSTDNVLKLVSYLAAYRGSRAKFVRLSSSLSSTAFALQIQFHVHQHFLKGIGFVQQALSFVQRDHTVVD